MKAASRWIWLSFPRITTGTDGVYFRMIRDARERVNSLEEAGRYAGVIEEEFRLQSLNDPRGMSDEKISEVLEALRKAKGGQSS